MKIPDRINAFHKDMTAWRRDLHALTELGFDEHRTSEFVAGKLANLAVRFIAILAKPVSSACFEPAMAHRSDCEQIWMLCRSMRPTTSPYRPKHDGRMHACGHDGHTRDDRAASDRLPQHPRCGHSCAENDY
jgi:metal-dependent amidase/aminoacylase/carboxypeptidase family protein